MSTNVLLKTGAGLLSTAVISLGGYELHNYLTATLESEFSLIPKEARKWEKLATKYERTVEKKKLNGFKEMENFNIGNGSQDEKKKQLMDHCKSLLKTSLRENEDTLKKRREEVRTWCIPSASALKKQGT